MFTNFVKVLYFFFQPVQSFQLRCLAAWFSLDFLVFVVDTGTLQPDKCASADITNTVLRKHLNKVVPA